MNNQKEIETLLKTAKTGDKESNAKILSLLRERFLSLMTLELQRYPILQDKINDEISLEICEYAITEITRLYPLTRSGWSLSRIVAVFHNIVDDFIANSLVELAREGNGEAENLLFSIIRKKLIERVNKKRWRVGQGEYQN